MRISSPPQGIVKTQLGRVVNKKDRASGLGVARSDVLVNLICNFAKEFFSSEKYYICQAGLQILHSTMQFNSGLSLR